MSTTIQRVLMLDALLTHCVWCSRVVDGIPLWKRLIGGPVLCRGDEDECALIGQRMREDGPEPEPEHPDRIPPEDLMVCGDCGGSGVLDFHTNPYGGLGYDQCRACDGTGERAFP